MDKDSDSRLLAPGKYRDALNIKVSSSDGSDVGAIETVLSNSKFSNIIDGAPTTYGCRGAHFDTTGNKIYAFFSSGAIDSKVVEFDPDNPNPDTNWEILLEDTRTTDNVLKFSSQNLITGVAVIVDTDNDKRYLVWTDNKNPIRFINIEEAKGYSANSFTEAQVSLIKSPPLYAPTITLSDTGGAENNIKEKFIRFATRYRYSDGQISAFSPFTEPAFFPEAFEYNYNTSTNNGMVNTNNKVEITFKTGPAEVVAIDLLYKEANSNVVRLVQTYKKEDYPSWSDNSDIAAPIEFLDDKFIDTVADDQLTRLYDNVPIRAQALEVIANRIILGNYTENYDITDESGNSITLDFTVDYDTTSVSEGTAAKTMKSNRQYEVGIVYLDDFGRMSTVLVSPNNTVFIPNSAADTSNRIKVTISHEAPSWATRYRFFLKQPEVTYYTITSSIFYVDGTNVWLRLEAGDISKVSAGDFIYVKSDTSGFVTNPIKAKVLEVKEQERNFLEDSSVTETKQVAGTYMKLAPDGYTLNPEDVTITDEPCGGFRSGSTPNNVTSNNSYVEEPYYVGTSVNDMTVTGSYTGTEDIRYTYEIINSGSPDTYRVSSFTVDTGTDNGYLNPSGAAGDDIPPTGIIPYGPAGTTVTFADVDVHDPGDTWIVSAKADDRMSAWDGSVNLGEWSASAASAPDDFKNRMMVFYKGKDVDAPGGEGIKGGASITISYDDTNSDGSSVGTPSKYTKTFTSSKNYPNLEEWFFGDNIISQLDHPTASQWNYVAFRRGEYVKSAQQIAVDETKGMFMIFLSDITMGASLDPLRADPFPAKDNRLLITEIDNNVIFETVPPDNEVDLFFELSQTYDIDGDHEHQGNGGDDVDQDGSTDAEIFLPTFNSFTFGNGFESYRIRDEFTGKELRLDTRASSNIDDYRQNVRVADLTYSKNLEQSTNFNGLNEFNLSTANFKQMDDKYGSIQKLYGEDTNLIVFMEDKVFNVPVNKDILTDAGGGQFVQESSNVLGDTSRAYAGEYGISLNPESFAVYGNSKYFVDTRRGVVCRLSVDGITEISQYGMNDFFRDFMRTRRTSKKIGAFDLHDKEYVMNIGGNDGTLAFSESVKGFPSFYSFVPDWMGSLNGEFYSIKSHELWLHHDSSLSSRCNFYGTDYDATVKLIVNEGPSIIKVLKSAYYEGNKAWKMNVKGYLNDETTSITEVEMAATDFVNKEGKFYTGLRRSNVSGDLTGKDVYGVGTVSGVSGQVLTFAGGPLSTLLAVGDILYTAAGVSQGAITAVNRTARTVTVAGTVTLTTSDFAYAAKPARIEGSEIRGYNFEVDITDETNLRTELFLVGFEAFASLHS